MSKLSKKLRVQRKRRHRKECNKTKISSYSKVLPDLSPVVQFQKGLRVTTVPLTGINHQPLLFANCSYCSAADFSIDPGWIKYWGYSFGITNDIHGNFIIYWKERFPLFDDIDYELDGRHFRMMFVCTSKAEALTKKALIESTISLQSANSRISLYHIKNSYTKREYKKLLPFIFYEDSVKAIAVENADQPSINQA